MAFGKKELIRELKHEINSPLAAIRNALYLTALRVCDPEIKRYLKLADEEVCRIATVLNRAHQMNESKAFTSASAALSRLLWQAEKVS
jgi:nitrogen-specific signal transduction histidine kinase